MTAPRVVRAPAEAAPLVAAGLFAAAVRRAVDSRGRAVVAVSGGSTPAPMLARLASLPLPWTAVWCTQVDERVAPDGDPARNLPLVAGPLGHRLGPRLLSARVGTVAAQDAARQLADDVAAATGGAPLDVVHLGLGSDGHTASLVPGDPVLDVGDRDVAVTRPYGGHRRVTLTYPALDRVPWRVWLVVGADKAAALRRLVARDPTIPAGRLRPATDVVVTDLDPTDAT